MGTKRAPRERKAPAIAPWLEGQSDVPHGEAWWSACVRRSTARGLQEAREQEQSAALGRSRSERQARAQGERQGAEEGPVQTAAGVCRWPGPHVRGRREPSRSTRWAARGRTRAVLTRLRVEREAGGRAQRDLARAWAVMSYNPCKSDWAGGPSAVE
jgi:hypothetical protein